MSVKPVIVEKIITAPIEHVYRAFTNSSAFREWMCDLCLADPQPQGRLYFGWNGPFYAAGEYTAVEPNHSVVFTWLGRGEPGSSWVKVTLSTASVNVHLHLEHGGFGDGEDWKQARQIFQASWESGLENLVSVLETGRDLRIVNRPMLGIYPGQFDAEIAQRLSSPVTEGVRIEGLVEEMGAQRAGLQTDDIIVRMGTWNISGFHDLNMAMQSAKAGDTIEVEYYRQAEKKIVSIQLSGRPIPEIPDTAQALSEAIEKLYSEIIEKLDSLFNGVSEAQAGYQPAPGEWSAKEVLAHLIHSEQGLHTSIVETIMSAEPIYERYPENWSGRNYATISAFPGIKDLIEEYRRLMQETIVLISEIPAEFVARKGSYWRFVFNLLQLSYHFNSHANQIKAAMDAAPGESR